MKANKLIIFGGSGYVGQSIIINALSLGLQVVSVSLKGRPKLIHNSLLAEHLNDQRITWLSCDLMSGNDSWMKYIIEHKDDFLGAASCIGAFGSNDYMEKINGDCNIDIIKKCHSIGNLNYIYI